MKQFLGDVPAECQKLLRALIQRQRLFDSLNSLEEHFLSELKIFMKKNSSREAFIEEHNTWFSKWKPFIEFIYDKTDILEVIYKKLKDIKHTGTIIYPPQPVIYRAFQECGYDDLKVVILGQDPYFDGSATGLAFDNNLNKRVSPSLNNILQNILNDDKISPGSMSGSVSGADKEISHLEKWPSQGVLLLNTALTVEAGKPNSHKEIWEPFTEEVVKFINKKDNIIWVLWGANALKYKKYITNETHWFIISSHPSPLSCNKTLKEHPSFKDSRPFSTVNECLKELKLKTIKW